MQKLLSLLIGLFFCSNAFPKFKSQLEVSSCIDCYDFVAPTVYSAEALVVSQSGTLVFDRYLNSFRAKALSGVWGKISKDINFRTVNSSQNILWADELINIDATGGSLSLTLPSALGLRGKIFGFKKTDSTFYQVSIVTNGIDLIDGVATKKISTQNEYLEIISNGSSWTVKDRQIPTLWSSFATNGSWTSGASYSAKWRRIGDSAEFQFKAVLTGSPSPSAQLTFDLPSGLSIDSSKALNLNFVKIVGQGNLYQKSVDIQLPALAYIKATITPTIIYVGLPYASTHTGTVYNSMRDITPGIPWAFAAQDEISVLAKIPVAGWEG